MLRKLFGTAKIVPVEEHPAVVKAQAALDDATTRHEAAKAAILAAQQRLVEAEDAASVEVLNGTAPADLHEHHQKISAAQSTERIFARAVGAARTAHREAVAKARAELSNALRSEYVAAAGELEQKIRAAIEPLKRVQALRYGSNYGLGSSNPLRGAPDPLTCIDEQALARFGALMEAWATPKPAVVPEGVKAIRLLRVPYGPSAVPGSGRRLTNLNVGETGGFPAGVADEWVKAGFAEYVT